MTSTPASQADQARYKPLPLSEAGLTNIAGVPYLRSASELLRMTFRLGMKQIEILPAKHGFTNSYTLDGVTATAHHFMYGNEPARIIDAMNALRQALETDVEGFAVSIFKTGQLPSGLALLRNTASAPSPSLESPDQFAMGWTNYEGIYDQGLSYLPAFMASLTDAEAATKQFWPTLADFSFPHNLIVLEKIRQPRVQELQSRFGDAWTSEGMAALCEAGRLYGLDVSILDCVASPMDNPVNRYTHATFTLLRQDPVTNGLEPIAIWLSGKNVDGEPRIYTRTKATPGAWLYALHAAKTSITVYAIWVRHVYLWHIVPATMQMTMYNSLDSSHPIYQMMAPQSKYTIAFNEVMLLLWGLVAPPTSLTTPFQLLKLCDEFAKGRGFFEDDPKPSLERLGLEEKDFSRKEPWDLYPAVKDMLELWDATEQYVGACVEGSYPDDAAVAGDAGLQAWLAAAAAPDNGNLRGLEPLAGKAALKRLLTSLLHRVIAHGGARIVAPTLLVHLFASNYPICLQRRDIPAPDVQLDTKQLLTFLPNAHTIGIMSAFYFSFNFTKPYEPFVPAKGAESNLFFPSGMEDPRNRALVAYRNALIRFVKAREILPDQIGQWPLNVEL